MRSASERLSRIRAGGEPRVLDLFAGCGGFSLGFAAAGFRVSGAVESDPLACLSHAKNFFLSADGAISPEHQMARDIVRTEPVELVAHVSPEAADWGIDVIIGGPPCQAFARIGRAKLREVVSDPFAFKRDQRHALYLRYLHYVRELRPLALVMENVPDIMNFAGRNIYNDICVALHEYGYRCAYTLLNAVHYGVPQFRERAFLIALLDEVGDVPEFPAPTRSATVPVGYRGARQVALQPLRSAESTGFFTPPVDPSPDLPPAVTTHEALGDLAPITRHLSGEMRRGARRFQDPVPYRSDVLPSSYAALMRTWPRFGNENGPLDHVIRHLPRDYPIFREMKPGDQYPEAARCATALFETHVRAARLQPGSSEYAAAHAAIVPPYDVTKFPNKWRKLEPDQPSRTLMAHLGKDSYSHIHYDSAQARTISVREAARLQSFPDGFIFAGTMNPAFRQIGNAVPPLMALALAEQVRIHLGGSRGRLKEETGKATTSACENG